MDFNKMQMEVIEELKRNIYLTAPAGTGKTMVLSERINKILNSGINGSEILCITFTNKACMELKERVLLRTENKGKNIVVKTFHSFCLSIVKEFAKKKSDVFYDFLVFDEEDTKELIKRFNFYKDKDGNIHRVDVIRLQNCINLFKEVRIEKEFFSGNEKEDLKNTLNWIKKDKNLLMKLEEKTKFFHDRQWKNDLELKNLFLNHGDYYVNIYNTVLITNRGLDFNDLLSKAKEILNDENIVKFYRSKYKYISIDEMQDTGIVEYEIIRKLFKGNNILLCGDFFQTIYSFRGSNPEVILEDFRKTNPKEISFEENYRSTEIINRVSTRFLKNNFKEKFEYLYKNGLKSFSEEEGDKIEVIERETIKEEAKGIALKCASLKRENKNLRSTCILTRNNYINKELSEAIRGLDINLDFEFGLVDDFKFFRRSEVKDIIAFFKVIVNENDTLNLERILKRLNTNISEELLKRVSDNEHRRLRVKLNDYLSDYTEFGEYYTNLINGLDKSEIIVFDVESTGVDVTEDEIIQIAAIRLDSNGREIEKFERFINPTKSVGKSYLVHGFTDEKLKEVGEEKNIVFEEFLKFIEGKIVVGHNVNYDISILSSELSRMGDKRILVKGIYDTLEIYRRFYSNLSNHKLEYLSEKFNTRAKPSHDALDDIRATGEILVMAINNKIRESSKEREKLIEENYRKFNKFRMKLNKIREESLILRSYEIIDYLLENFNFFGRYSEIEKKIKKENINKLKEILKYSDNKDKCPKDSIIEAINITGLSNGELEELLLDRTGKIRIPILTVHQAKGLEYDNVFISGLVEGVFPNKKGNLDEEKRLFYVAMTRAKKRIILTYSKRNYWGKLVEKSSFFKLI